MPRVNQLYLARQKGLCVPTEWEARVPLPPSANHMWRACQRRVHLSRNYRRWIAQALPAVGMLVSPSMPCRFRFRICGRLSNLRDGDNFQKPLLDLCVRAGVIPDDRLEYVQAADWQYIPGTGPPFIILWFEPL